MKKHAAQPHLPRQLEPGVAISDAAAAAPRRPNRAERRARAIAAQPVRRAYGMSRQQIRQRDPVAKAAVERVLARVLAGRPFAFDHRALIAMPVDDNDVVLADIARYRLSLSIKDCMSTWNVGALEQAIEAGDAILLEDIG